MVFHCNCNMQFHMEDVDQLQYKIDKRMVKLQLVQCASTIAFILIILYWLYITIVSIKHTQHMNKQHTLRVWIYTLTFQTATAMTKPNAQRRLQLNSNAICCVLSISFFLLYSIPICIRAWATERHVRLTHDWNIQNLFAAGNCTPSQHHTYTFICSIITNRWWI